MTLVELEHRLAERLGLEVGETSRVLRGALQIVGERLSAGEDVKIVGFGRFGVRTEKARRRKDPRNGDDIDAPARRRTTFRPSRLLLDQINKDAAGC